MENGQSVCGRCVDDSYLRAEIERRGSLGECSYCSNKRSIISLDDLATKVEGVFDKYFERTPSQPNDFESAILRDAECGYNWDRKGDPIDDVIAGILSSDVP